MKIVNAQHLFMIYITNEVDGCDCVCVCVWILERDFFFSLVLVSLCMVAQHHRHRCPLNMVYTEFPILLFSLSLSLSLSSFSCYVLLICMSACICALYKYSIRRLIFIFFARSRFFSLFLSIFSSCLPYTKTICFALFWRSTPLAIPFLKFHSFVVQVFQAKHIYLLYTFPFVQPNDQTIEMIFHDGVGFITTNHWQN